MFRFFTGRLAEPSTWAAAGVVTATVAETLASGYGWTGAGMAVLGMFMRDPGSRK